MITDYIVLEAEDAPQLQADVLAFIKKGWKPQSGVAMGVNSRDETNYIQAMILEDGK